MFLKQIHEIRYTLASRLTLWYAIIFMVSSLVAVAIFYMIITNVLKARSEQELLNDVSELVSIYMLKGEDSFKSEMDIEAESDGIEKIFFRLLDPMGIEIAASNMSSWQDIEINQHALNRILNGEDHVFEILTVPKRPHGVRIVYSLVGHDRILQIGLSLDEDARFLEIFRKVFTMGFLFLLCVSTIIGWFMAKRALSSIEEVTNTAIEISKGAFEKRVEIKADNKEVHRLAMAFNRMLDYIQDLIRGLREVTDNIAHDIKTPITRIRGLAELELNKDPSGDTSQHLAADTIEECDNLLQMINTMLEISEAEAGVVDIAPEPLDMVKLIDKALDLFRPIAEEKGIRLDLQLPDHSYVHGDKNGLQRMVVHLLDNSIKYTPPGGTVTASLQDHNGHVLIRFDDTGIGISEEDLPHIFQRLYRCDRSRSQTGYGLGLSLALAIARAHGGNITVTSRLAKGSQFIVILPQ
jgi:signal transduction histidine kinase